MNRNRKWFMSLIMLFTILVVVTGCSGTGTTTTTTPAATVTSTSTVTSGININGVGATFPAPLYTKWFDVYYKDTGIKINYQAIGSGGGINQITEGTVDFGASDGIMTETQQSKAEEANGPILHIPMTSGAVAVIYNISGISSGQLNLSGDVLADIYLKKITKWNDYRISDINPDITLPDADIAVVHRSDGSGTTYIFTNYLSKVSTDWASEVGNATSVDWPGDIGGEKNAGVAGQVQQLPNSIGYVELAYALQNNIAFANLENAAGNFITPSIESTTKAAEGITLPDDMKVMLTNSSNPEAYPIVGFTWILVYENQKDKEKGEAIVNMLWWAIHEGQQYTTALSYAPLADDAVTRAENQILSIKYQGETLLKR